MTGKAKESRAVAKARKKLREQITSEQHKITPEALSKVTRSIISWLDRRATERIHLKEKEFTALFDKNAHSADIKSRYVVNLLNELKTQSKNKIVSLEGRITRK